MYGSAIGTTFYKSAKTINSVSCVIVISMQFLLCREKKNTRINIILLRRFWFFRHFFGRGKFGLNCSEYNENGPSTKFLFFFSVATVEIGGGGGGGNGKKKT